MKIKYSLMNPLKFLFALLLFTNLLSVQAQDKEKRSGIMRLDGTILTPAIFKEIYPWVQSLEDGQTKLVALSDTGQSLIGSEGKVISKKEYDRIMTIPDFRLSEVRRDAKSGFINEQGEEIVPLIYDEFINRYKHRDWYVMMQREDGMKVGMIDSLNNVKVPFEYSKIKVYKKNEFDEQIPCYNIALQKNRDKWALADTTGKPITPFVYDNINLFEKGGACASIGDSISYFVSSTGIVIDSMYGCKDIQELDYFITIRTENQVTNKLNLTLYNSKGNKLKMYEGNLLFPFTTDHLAAIETDGDYIMIDTLGQEVSRLDVAGFSIDGLAFYNRRAVAGRYLNDDKDYRCGIIDIKGNEIVPFVYNYLELLLSNDSLNVYRVRDKELDFQILFLKNDKATLLPQKYDLVSNYLFSYDSKPYVSSSLLYVRSKDFKYGLLSLNGDEILPPLYDGMNSSNDTLVMIKQSEKIGFYNILTKAKIEPVFDKYEFTKYPNITIVTKDGQKGIINTNCNLILDCIYKEIEISTDKAYVVATNQDNQSAIFDSKGNLLRPFGREHLSPFIKDMFIFSPQ